MPTNRDAAESTDDTTLASPPRLHFAFGAAFWRIAAGVFLVREALIWAKITRVAPGVDWPKRLGYVLLKTPESFFVAFASAAAAAVVLDQVVRQLTRPRVAWWLSPKVGDALAWPIAFRLGATERVEFTVPARRAVGRSWAPGGLVLTDRRLWFFPGAWDAEPWSVPRDGLARSVGREPAPPLSWGFVTGLPDRITYRNGPVAETFAVLDPEPVLAHLGSGEASGRPGQPDRSQGARP